MLGFDVKKYVWQYIFSFLRKNKLLQLIYALAHPIEEIWLLFKEWRSLQYYNINLFGQTYSLQEHLNNSFDNTQRRIYIAHFIDLGVSIPLESEGYDGIIVGLESEGEGKLISLTGEIQEAIGVSFQVFVPIEINSELVKKELYKYKLAGKSFGIIVN
ncbi:MAG: hypothetical protein JXA16_01070 [Bacteroidales bacterium]|nr:hypothetical protein [Bacteroidales bacterium]